VSRAASEAAIDRPLPAPIAATLDSLLKGAPLEKPRRREHLVVFSDLHLGNGGSRDDFRPNSSILQAALERYYLPGHYRLVLNGDVEELQRFHLQDVRRRWAPFYELLGEFARGGRLERIVGNHDAELLVRQDPFPAPRLLEGLRLETDEGSLFLFHGHQASILQTRFLGLASAALRYVGNPLGIRNWSVSESSPRKFRVEKRVYSFAHRRQVMALIGHTHRPMFESLSKLDILRFGIERLCRELSEAHGAHRHRLEAELLAEKADLQRLLEKRGRAEDAAATLYTSPLLVPCLFNSGCCIGKRGVTGLELAGGRISLVHWFDRTRNERYLGTDERSAARRSGRSSEALPGTPYHRMVLREDTLSYLFTRIRLLA
jgi:UDP-2,3-diacylglucosamine pyrophosphatase LpxH